MMPFFLESHVDMALFFSTLAIWFAVESRQYIHRRVEATNKDRGSAIVLRLCAAVGAVLAALGLNVRFSAFSYGPLAFGVGLGLMFAGICLRWWCFRTLGQYFTFTVMTSTSQQVVDVGPYRILRHPSYAALLLVLIGIGLTYGNWLSLLALTILPLAGLMNRIRVEETALAAALGPAYMMYASTRKRLIPFVW
jgi:protein-S-isoprenylcysteine O-methyltransferase Ste14